MRAIFSASSITSNRLPASVFAEQSEQAQLRLTDRYDDLERSTSTLPFFEASLLSQPLQECPGHNDPFIAVEIFNILHTGTDAWCRLMADGWYEWKRDSQEKQPYLIRMKGGSPFAFAGLWSIWRSPDGEDITSSTIMTTLPHKLMVKLHNRMPVILGVDDRQRWVSLRGRPSCFRPFSHRP